ncbi:hypothetical protein [Nodosilinea nodulosa]|uniref:hypothetical protein n=1 Tax=Nodosilinea nodulosa TaxID=416001 RepID=UPI0012D707FA|nr:hypothetical protein [Nodosilinea nodulosa]
MTVFRDYEAAIIAFRHPADYLPQSGKTSNCDQRKFDVGDQVCWYTAQPQSGRGRKWGRVIHWGYIPESEGGQGDWCYIVAVPENKPFQRQERYAVVWQADLVDPRLIRLSNWRVRHLKAAES